MVDWPTVPVRISGTWVPRLSGRLPEVVGLGLAAVGLSVYGGPSGAVAAVLTITVWVLANPEYAASVGILFAVVSVGFPLGLHYGLVVTTYGIGILLIVETVTADDPFTGPVTMLTGVSILGGIAALLFLNHAPIWLIGLSQLVVFGSLAYGLHRYERLRLGLIETAPAIHHE